jgi:uncharacterized protein YbjT (DUF2867 family)
VLAPPPHPLLPRLERTAAALPFVPVPDTHGARFQPIAADDVAAALEVLVVGTGHHGAPDRVELAGPDTATLEEIVRVGLAAIGRPRRLLRVPSRVMRPALAALGRIAPGGAYLTGDEVELLRTSMVSPTGAAGAEALGVSPRPLTDVLRR